MYSHVHQSSQYIYYRKYCTHVVDVNKSTIKENTKSPFEHTD